MHCIFFLVEGPDDEDFFKCVIAPRLRTKGKSMRTARHASGCTDTKLRNYIESAMSSFAQEYYFVRDLDTFPTVDECVRETCATYSALDPARVLVSCRTIEGWYLAGVCPDTARALGLRNVPENTDSIDKRAFERALRRGHTAGQARKKIREKYDFDAAVQRNNSFAVCVSSIGL